MNYTKSILFIFLVLTALTLSVCPENCEDCDEGGNICFSCSGDYQVNVFGGCHANTIDKCIIYGPTDQCFRCQPTYSLVDGKCIKIFTGCVNEGSPNQCFECGFGLTLNGTICIGIINCDSFSGGKCNKCKDGFTLSGKICKDSTAGCTEVRPSDGICTKCKQGYFQSGYQCFQQKTKNNRCYVQDNNDKCQFCKSGFNGVDGKCLLNKQMNGAQPSSSGGDSFGYSGTSSTSSIATSTTTTTTLTTSSSNNGFPPNNDHQNELLPAHIQNCQVPDPIGQGCTVCVYGWFPKNNVCQLVSPLCDGHNVQTGQCFACRNDLSLEYGRCVDKNCVNSKDDICQKCKQNFYINAVGSCKQLPPFCSAANPQTGSCLQCIKDYEIVSNGAPCSKKIVIQNCQTIDPKNNSKCLICAERYFPDDKKCSKVSSTCKDYNLQNGKCTSCSIQGFTLDNGKCIDINCIQKNNDDSCSNCKPNFVFSNSQKICKLNDPNCKTQAISSCLECKTGFYLTNQKICKILPTNCQNVDQNTNKCITCASGFYTSAAFLCIPVSPTCNTYNLSNGWCTSCISNLKLQSDGSCATAIQFNGPAPTLDSQTTSSQISTQGGNKNFGPANQPSIQGTVTTTSTNSGQKSDLNCRQYNGNKCVKCSNRYYVGPDGRCIPVNPLCRQSNSAGQCTSCYPGYKVQSGKCIISQSQDANCKTFQGQQCSECYQGFYYNQNNKICKRLNPLCKTSNLQTGTCTSCYNGYNVNPNNGNCQVFFKDSNCKEFKSDGGCKLCSNRYYINSNGKCSAANPLCRQYNQFNGACTACYPGYGLTQDNIALCVAGVSSDPNCKSFQSSTCRQCVNGFFFGPDGKCKQASPLCKTFDTNNGYCLTCYNGYVISNNGNCAINQNQDTNCKKFDGQNQCVSCYQGYIPVRGKCTNQNPLCKQVDMNNGGCTSCWPGYSLTGDANCVEEKASQNPNSNDPYCIQLTNGICTQCSSGFYFNQGQGLCVQLNSMCKTSDTTNGACTTCYVGYTISGTQCVPAQVIQIPNCLNVGPTGQCIECVDGSYLNKDKVCVQVSILCAGYNKQTGDCTGCVSGYFFQDNICVYPALYDQNCVRYENSYCSRCRLGFYLSNYLCQAIDPNCTSFNYNNLSCDQCANNMYPNGPSCS